MPEITDYLITLIIITIIGFIVTTAFYVYFVYLPAARAEAQIDTINTQGENLITLVNERVLDFEEETIENLRGICESIRLFICKYNNNSITNPCIPGHLCKLESPAYPEFCNQFDPFGDACDACPPV